ncbi:MAG: hypothetical protein KDD62_14055, partial [Bdellovibrionales bacterium]|nr:hypothetical protein [Bdellovibrionales bacterium]
MKTFTFVLLALFGSALFYMTADFPPVGDPLSPPSKQVSPYYLKHSIRDTHTPNVVSAVLGDYRGFDTMLETAVVLAGGIAIL